MRKHAACSHFRREAAVATYVVRTNAFHVFTESEALKLVEGLP